MPRPDSVAAVAPESTVAARESAAIAVPGLVLASPGLREAAATEHRAQAAPALPFEAHLSAALQSPDFAPALATQVSWLVQEGVQLARLTLNPAEMGPLAVHIVVDGSTARVDFSADLAATRSAIEAGLPSLAAALQDSGLTLSGGGVFDRQGRQGAEADARQGQPGGRATSNQDALAQGDATPGAALASRPTRGLVDLLA